MGLVSLAPARALVRVAHTSAERTLPEVATLSMLWAVTSSSMRVTLWHRQDDAAQAGAQSVGPVKGCGESLGQGLAVVGDGAR